MQNSSARNLDGVGSKLNHSNTITMVGVFGSDQAENRNRARCVLIAASTKRQQCVQALEVQNSSSVILDEVPSKRNP